MRNLRCFYSKKLNKAITGSTGFIGNSIIATSKADFCPVDFVQLPNDVVVIHCASDLSNSRESLLINLDLDSYIIEEVNKRHIGLVYLSSNNVYPLATHCKISEPLTISDYYSASKTLGESMVSGMLKKRYSIIRVADVFGKEQRHGNFFKALEHSIFNNQSIDLIGPGLKLRSYIYIRELANFLLHTARGILAKHEMPVITNLCYEDSMTLKEIAEFVIGQTQGKINHIEPSGDNYTSVDVRTMVPGPFIYYKFLWPSFKDALLHYINTLQRIEA